MSIVYREGSLEECIQVVEQITEFSHKETVQTLAACLEDKTECLILVAEESGTLLGFKIGYQLDELAFYSWFGGVSLAARNKGVAQKLLDKQEEWVANRGYKQLKVKSRNEFPAMLRLLLRNGYMIEKFEEREPLTESRVHFLKQF